jgi:hypothetical protein
MTLILIILLLLILFGGGYGYRTGYVTYGNPIGIILFIVIIIILLGLIAPRFGWWTYY